MKYRTIKVGEKEYQVGSAEHMPDAEVLISGEKITPEIFKKFIHEIAESINNDLAYFEVEEFEIKLKDTTITGLADLEATYPLRPYIFSVEFKEKETYILDVWVEKNDKAHQISWEHQGFYIGFSVDCFNTYIHDRMFSDNSIINEIADIIEDYADQMLR